MPLTLVVEILVLLVLAGALAFYAVRGLQKGKIYLGFRGTIETWGDRQKAPELFWFAVVAAMIAAGCMLPMALKAVKTGHIG